MIIIYVVSNCDMKGVYVLLQKCSETFAMSFDFVCSDPELVCTNLCVQGVSSVETSLFDSIATVFSRQKNKNYPEKNKKKTDTVLTTLCLLRQLLIKGSAHKCGSAENLHFAVLPRFEI